MTRSSTWFVLVAGLLAVARPDASAHRDSLIVDFAPTSFPGIAATKFFYSIHGDLKYSDHIDPDAPTILHGTVRSFVVSPAGDTIAAVVEGTLLIVGPTGVLADVTTVDSIYRRAKPIGRQFIRDNDFQWSRDAQSLYVIRDEYYRSKGSQLSSQKGELWKYHLHSGVLELVLKPFVAFCYFFPETSGVYYGEDTPYGNYQLKFFNGGTPIDVGARGADEVRELPTGKDEKLFYSLPSMEYYRALPVLGVRFATVKRSANVVTGDVIISDRTYLSSTMGVDAMGDSYWCTGDTDRSTFLPGGRFLVFNIIPGCKTYTGQLLIDLRSGQYQTLPKDTKVFVTLNTDNFQHFRVSSAGMELRK